MDRSPFEADINRGHLMWRGIYSCCATLLAMVCVGVPVASAQQTGPASTSDEGTARIIVLTDIGNEPDDSESMVRLLLYTNDLEIEGLVATTSRHLPSGVRPELIESRVAAYGKVLNNLRVHDPRYPDAVQLRDRIRAGSNVYGMSGVGAGHDTEASRLIIEAVDRPDPRSVWVTVWGGAADLAQALWTVRATRTPQQVEQFVAKLRVYSISDQDDAGPWARAHFPKLFWITSVHGFTRYQYATWPGISAPVPGSDPEPVSKAWLKANVQAHGPLGALYPTPAFIMEGDTPSFLHLIPNGLGFPNLPNWGGWGGRYEALSRELGLWSTAGDTVRGADGATYSTQHATIWRWRWAYQNDFAARMRWTVTSNYQDANHAPVPRLNDVEGLGPVKLSACPGQPVKLTAHGSHDPDGNQLSYRWWWYPEATGLFAPDVSLSADSGEDVIVTVGKTVIVDQFSPPSTYDLHIILAVTDNGLPKLTRYRRAVISVPGAATVGEIRPCAVQPVFPVIEAHPVAE